jgi:hypothetical protein
MLMNWLQFKSHHEIDSIAVKSRQLLNERSLVPGSVATSTTIQRMCHLPVSKYKED